MNPRALIGLVPLVSLALAAALVTPALGADGSRTYVDPADVQTTTPIKHFITLMQENHSFDNYFGTYPGADGIPEGTCIPRDPDDRSQGCIKPHSLSGDPIIDLGHTGEVFQRQLNKGRMDGFVDAVGGNPDAQEQVMGYYDDRDLPYYWNIADDYVLFDRFFTSAAGGSVWNHFFWVTGRPGNARSDSLRAEGFDNIPTIFDRLQKAGISWKFYVQNYDPSITFRNPGVGDRGAQIVWVPLLNYNRFLDDPALRERIVPLREFYTDLENGTLPSVSYMVPSGASEHPPGSIQAGERFVRTLITKLMLSSAWDSSAFMWTYDDWGGWYDHVKPPKVDRYGYGFRAPALLVSPYAKRGHIDSTTLDFTSKLKFIEQNWGLDPLARRDANANNFLTAFDFEQEPRTPALLGLARTEPALPEPRTGVVYVFYGTALAVALLFIASAQMLHVVRRRRPGYHST